MIPKISIIIPIYNVEKYLKECLNSVLSQTLQDIEVVCVNDGSTDGSKDILDEYSKRDNRLKIINQENLGYGKAMNVGILQSSGEYIAIVEPDDFVLPTMMERLYCEAIANSCEIVKSDFYRFVGEGENLIKNYQKTGLEDKYYSKVLNPQIDKICFRFIMNTWSGIYKREFIKRHSIYHNETPGASYQDNGFFLKSLFFATRIMIIPEAFYMNRRDNIFSSVRSKEKIYEMNYEYSLIQKFMEDNALYDSFKDVFWLKRYHSYIFTLYRISFKYRLKYLIDISNEFSEALSCGSLIKGVFHSDEWTNLMSIIDNPDEYFYNVVCKKTKVSVILPVYNEEKYLLQCLNGLINQSLKDIEIICVDDGSTDGSYRILKEFESKDSRIRVLKCNHKGAGAARNIGLKEANGQYLYFPDSDDCCTPTLLMDAYEKAELTQSDIVIFKSKILDNKTGQMETCNYSLHLDKLPEICPFSIKDINGNFFRYIMGWSWDKLYSRRFIESNRLDFQEIRTTNDMFFTYASILKACRISTLDKELYVHRKNIDSSLSMTRDESWYCFYEALCGLRQEMMDMNIWMDYKRYFIDYSLHICLSNLCAIGDHSNNLYYKLKNEWFSDLEIIDSPSEWFTSKKEYEAYLILLRGSDFDEDVSFIKQLLQKKSDNSAITSDEVTDNSAKEIISIKEQDILREERDYYKYCLAETRNSISFKIGRIITWLPRKIRGW